jgi:hypothetical protein
MKLFRTKIWTWLDIAFLKWSAILFGMVAGAYFADFIKRNVMVFLLAAIALAILPAISYFNSKD